MPRLNWGRGGRYDAACHVPSATSYVDDDDKNHEVLHIYQDLAGSVPDPAELRQLLRELPDLIPDPMHLMPHSSSLIP